MEGRRPLGRSRISCISQLKKDAGINTNVELMKLAGDCEKWKMKLNVVNQPITGLI